MEGGVVLWERLDLSLSLGPSLLASSPMWASAPKLPWFSPHETLDLALLFLKFNYIYYTESGSFVFRFLALKMLMSWSPASTQLWHYSQVWESREEIQTPNAVTVRVVPFLLDKCAVSRGSDLCILSTRTALSASFCHAVPQYRPLAGELKVGTELV